MRIRLRSVESDSMQLVVLAIASTVHLRPAIESVAVYALIGLAAETDRQRTCSGLDRSSDLLTSRPG